MTKKEGDLIVINRKEIIKICRQANDCEWNTWDLSKEIFNVPQINLTEISEAVAKSEAMYTNGYSPEPEMAYRDGILAFLNAIREAKQ